MQKNIRRITILMMVIGLLVSGIPTVDAASNIVNAKKVSFNTDKKIMTLQVNRASLGFKKTIKKKAYKKNRILVINKVTASTVKVNGQKVNKKAITLKVSGDTFIATINNIAVDRTKDSPVKVQISGIKVKYYKAFKYKGRKKSASKVVGTKKTLSGSKTIPADFNLICSAMIGNCSIENITNIGSKSMQFNTVDSIYNDPAWRDLMRDAGIDVFFDFGE